MDRLGGEIKSITQAEQPEFGFRNSRFIMLKDSPRLRK